MALAKQKKRPTRKPARKKERTPRGITGFFFRGLITVLPVILTLIVFGLLFQMIDRYVTGPINSVIYWSLESNEFGWKALHRLDIDPLDPQYLDPSQLPLELQAVALSSPLAYASEEFIDSLAKYRYDNLGVFFHDHDDLAINSKKLRDVVKKRVHPLIGILSCRSCSCFGWAGS